MIGSPARRRGSYGYDAPYVLLTLASVTGVLVLAGLGVTIGLGGVVGWGAFLPAAVFAVMTAFFFHTTKRGKFQVWSGLLGDFRLRGDERLLDLGCGRGAVLLMAADRLPVGRAVGIDLWRTVDQSGNDPATTERNAEAEGVRDQVELRTGDLTDLPFGDGEFDVVLSSMAVHNIPSADGRARAVEEAVRVLRPGGRLLMVDIIAVEAYRRRLVDLGMDGVRVRPVGWRMWWGGPFLGTSVISAVKPSQT